MNGIDKERFGAFLAALRKEKGLTQRALAERLYVSDKAVSKWERGLSLPDVALLTPLSEALGVGVAELLRGERAERPLETAEVDALVSGALHLGREEELRLDRRKKGWKLSYLLCALAGLGETGMLLAQGFGWEELAETVALVEGLSLLFGAWLCFFVRESLPGYYDENRISFYGDGVFRMNLAGLRLNNSNRPHILAAMRGWLLGTAAVFPLLWWSARTLWPGTLQGLEGGLSLLACLGMFLPAYVVGKRYE